ncbi:hypothetical protein FHS19_002303 [Paenibacillus rhizosphaerae]|uniref:Uncharacterized protein n=1 Tax=Paenibacillus rhizosphaerae TaxID=297318 RepID=A0A839TQQ8_9BACL|nr:hypothetical protein [Paenibacillus rhizosphaerae]
MPGAISLLKELSFSGLPLANQHQQADKRPADVVIFCCMLHIHIYSCPGIYLRGMTRGMRMTQGLYEFYSEYPS